MNPIEFKKLLKEFAPKQKLTEDEDVIPLGPDGEKITDQQVIKNLNMAVRSIPNMALRNKLKAILTDPESTKELKNAKTRAAMIGAIAIAFGISEQEFTSIVSQIKILLKKSGKAAAVPYTGQSLSRDDGDWGRKYGLG